MKIRLIILFSLCLIFVSLSSCDKEPESNDINGLPCFTQDINKDNTVSLKDVFSYLRKEDPTTKVSDISSYDITVYSGNTSDTLMYIVNYPDNGGWKILSSDKRIPAVIAEGVEGYFSIEEGSPAVKVWMDCMASDIARIRRSSDDQLTFSEEEINANKNAWYGDRFNPDDPPTPIDPIGHWEEIITTEIEVVDSTDHMVAKWDQGDPYDRCCPYRINSDTQRAAAGCVAIAGSQMLLFLHNEIGLPGEMYSQGYCYGDVLDFSKTFYNLSDSVWTQMSMSYQSSSESTLPESVMISYVGHLVDMHYCDLGVDYFSWAFPSNLKYNVFEHYGINCSRGSYNESIVRESLLDGMPVVVSASDQMIPINGNIHCFVIDGYRRTRTKYTHLHHFVLEGGMTSPVIPDDYYTYSYSYPSLSSIKINWGWASQWGSDPQNDGWYSLIAGWTVFDSYDYNYNVYMTYGFSIDE